MSVEWTFSLPLPARRTGEAEAAETQEKPSKPQSVRDEKRESRTERLNMAAEASARGSCFLASDEGGQRKQSILLERVRVNLSGKSHNECN